MIKASIAAQKSLILASLDDFTASSMMPIQEALEDFEGHNKWKNSVINFLEWCLEKNLIAVSPDIYQHEELSSSEIIKFLRNGSIEHGIEEDMAFDVIYFDGTEKLKVIVDKYGMLNWESLNAPLNYDLFEEIGGIF